MEGRAEFVQLLSLVVLVQFLVASAGPVSDPHWYPAAATWYGSPEGDGSDGTSPLQTPIFKLTLLSLLQVPSFSFF